MGSRVSIQEWRPSINYAIQSERTQDLRKFKQGKLNLDIIFKENSVARLADLITF